MLFKKFELNNKKECFVKFNFRGFLLIICVILIFLSLIRCSKEPTEKKEIFIVFRFDDFDNKFDTEKVLRIFNIIKTNKISITVGVVPFLCSINQEDPSPQSILPIDSNRADILKTALKEGIIEIALHGYSHQTTDKNEFSEFSGISLEQQVEKITKGKRYLEKVLDCTVTTFIPPWNQYDINTLKALDMLKFSTISADPRGEVINNTALKFLPETCSLWDLRREIETTRNSTENQKVIVVLFHGYNFKDFNSKKGNITLKEFAELLHYLKIQENVQMMSIAKAVILINDLSVERFIDNQKIWSLSGFLIPQLRYLNSGQYYNSTTLNALKWRIGFFYFAILMFSFTVGFVWGKFISGISINMRTAFLFAGSILSVILIVYAIHDFEINWKGLTLIVTIFGASIGTGISILKNTNKDLSKKN
jgi:hypothetical protein